jgi:hypothetical protein
MSTQVRKVRIFAASPGDLESERNQLSKVVNELNLTDLRDRSREGDCPGTCQIGNERGTGFGP